MERQVIAVPQMDCPNESRVIEAALRAHPGVQGIEFDLLRQRVHVSWNAAHTSLPAVLAAIRATGFAAEVLVAAGATGRFPNNAVPSLPASSGASIALLWKAGLATAFFLLAVVARQLFPDDPSAQISDLPARTFFLLSILASASTYARRAWTSILRRQADMNLLVAIAAAGALLLGEWVEASLVSLLFAVAHFLEGWSGARVRKSIDGFLSLMPEVAERIDESSGHVHTVGLDALRRDDLLLVKPGARIPADGIVETGSSFVDQAMLTGESLPLEARPGVLVLAGSTNGEGALRVRATCDAAHSRVHRLEEAIEVAQRRRSPTERWVERFARVYTPLVLLVAAAVALLPLFAGVPFASSFYAALVLILIACPCALVIATPVTMVSAISGLARIGVLLRGGESLERAAKVRAVAFDKTGVLTTGNLKVSQLVPMAGVDVTKALMATAAVERLSEHPIARAVVDFAMHELANVGAMVPEASDYLALPGLGGEGSVDGLPVWVGSPALAGKHNAWSEAARRAAESLRAEGGALVAAGSGSHLWFLATLSDHPRPEAAMAVRKLRLAGISAVSMLSGDHERNCRTVAESLDIQDVHAGLLPEQKLEVLERMAKQHGALAMVGDGINDAPAMAAAWMSIAAGDRAADVTLQAADAVVWGGDLRLVPMLLARARRTMRVVHWNAAFAIGSKAVVAILALFGLATLWMAVLADVGATLVVTANGLRLLRVAQPAEIETSPAVVAPSTSS